MKRLTIDLSGLPSDRTQEYATILAKLRGKGLYEDNHLYTVVDGARLDGVLQAGTYRDDNSIFAFSQLAMDFFTDARVNNRFIEDLFRYDVPATVVWNGTLFTPRPGYEYVFKDPDKKLAAIDGIAGFKMR